MVIVFARIPTHFYGEDTQRTSERDIPGHHLHHADNLRRHGHGKPPSQPSVVRITTTKL
jgi:hypothetical protein